MKVAETFDRETDMSPIGMASCLMWKAFRGSGNGVKRLWAGRTRAVIYQPCRSCFICDIGVATATAEAVIELLWRQQLSGGGCHWSLYSSMDLLSCWPEIRQRQWRLLGEALTSTRDSAEVTFIFLSEICECGFDLYISFIFIKV